MAEWFFATISAQEGLQSELRTTYIHQHYLAKPRFWIRNDIGLRYFFEENPYAMALVRPRAIIELTDILDIHPAVDFRLSFHPDLLNTLEIRTWQGVSLN